MWSSTFYMLSCESILNSFFMGVLFHCVDGLHFVFSSFDKHLGYFYFYVMMNKAIQLLLSFYKLGSFARTLRPSFLKCFYQYYLIIVYIILYNICGICTCQCGCVIVYAGLYKCMWWPEVDVGFLYLITLHLYFLDRSASELQGSTCLYRTELGYRHIHHTCFLYGVGIQTQVLMPVQHYLLTQPSTTCIQFFKLYLFNFMCMCLSAYMFSMCMQALTKV